MESSIEKVFKKVKQQYINPIKFRHLKVGVKCEFKWYGEQHAGFYVNPNLVNKDSIVYSFGIGEDISFDREIIEAHQCKVYGFDPTPKSINWCNSQDLPANFQFHGFGISKETGSVEFHLPKNKDFVSGSIVQHSNVSNTDSVTVEMKSLSDILQMLGHDKIGVLKMDIEGSEYDVLDSILESSAQIDQIAIELHERFFENGKERSIKLVDKLKAHGYEIFAISNTYEEVSFIRKDAL